MCVSLGVQLLCLLPRLTVPVRCAADKNLNPSAICAVTMANVVLFSFIYYAFREDQADYERERQEKIENKAKTGKAE